MIENRALQRIAHSVAVIIRLGSSPKLATTSSGHTLDRSAYLLLSELDAKGPLAINIIAEELRLDISTASRQIAALEEKGFVSRYQDPANKRISIVEIAEIGRARLTEVRDSRKALYEDILKGWTDEEMVRFADGLERLIRDIKNRRRK